MKKIKKKKIKIKNGNILPIYYCIPKKFKYQKKKKIIIIIEEIFGINKKIKNICKKISKYKYMSVAPELIFKNKKNNFKKKTKKLKQKINSLLDKNIIFDIIYLINWLKKKYKTNNIGMTGFCWGGRITWLFSYFQNNHIKTSVIWYGKISDVKNYKHPIHPIDIIDKIKIPVLGLYGEKDKNISLNTVKMVKKKITLKNKKNKIIIFKKIKNNFLLNHKSTYNKKIAKKSWKIMINWFNINI